MTSVSKCVYSCGEVESTKEGNQEFERVRKIDGDPVALVLSEVLPNDVDIPREFFKMMLKHPFPPLHLQDFALFSRRLAIRTVNAS